MAIGRSAVHLAPHFRSHPVGAEDQRTRARRAGDLLAQYLEACRQDQSYHCLFVEADCLRPFLATQGEQRDFMRALAAAGRIQLGGTCNQPDELNLQGEGLIRNLVHGRFYHQELVKAKPDVCISLDVRGHCPQLPQIAAKTGFQGILWSRPRGGAPSLCLALAPDGTTLPARCDDWLRGRERMPESIEELLEWLSQWLPTRGTPQLSQELALFGSEMTPPASWVLRRSEDLAEHAPVITISTPHHYLMDVLPEMEEKRGVIPLVACEPAPAPPQEAVGRTELKIANRLAENRLLNAEKWATLAALAGARYPDLALDKAWRQVVFGQHPGAVGGRCGDIAYLDLLAGYREALELATEVEEKALAYTASRADTTGWKSPRAAGSLLVFNSQSWRRTDVCAARVRLTGPLAAGFRVADGSGREVPVQLVARSDEGHESWVEIAFLAKDVPSVGYSRYYLATASDLPPAGERAEAGETVIENEHFTIRADPEMGGGLISVYDKQAKREVLNPGRGPGNEVVALAEDPEGSGAWRPSTAAYAARSSERRAQVSVVRGPVFSQLLSRGELPGRGMLRQEVTLYHRLRRIEMRTVLQQYRGEHELLALAFPLTVSAPMATFEDRFATIVRMPDRDAPRGQGQSDCGLALAQNWVDVGPTISIAVMDRNRPAGAVPIGPCAVISARDRGSRGAAASLVTALLRRGIIATPLLDTDDVEARAGECGFRISLGRGNAYSERVLSGSPQAASALEKALAGKEWGAVLVSSPDLEGASPGIPVLVAETSNAGGLPRLGEILARAIESGDPPVPVTCDFSGLARPRESYGVALLNRGTPAAALAEDGTLVSLLCRTGPWADRPWGEGTLARFLVPEHRAQVFEHALLPHAGDWRQARVVQAGHEFNNPLRAVQAPLQSGALPAELSLVSVSAANGREADCPHVIISAVKPAGNPLAGCPSGERSLLGRGVLVRLYESQGKAANAQLAFAAEPQEAHLADLLEGRIGEAAITRPGWRRPAAVSLPIGAGEIATAVVRLAPFAERGEPRALGATREPYSPIHSRYWDHNLGAAPMGNQPLTVWLRGSTPPGANTRFLLGLSNDSRDREISGTAHLIAPQEWQLIPREVPFRIAPGSQAIYEVMVVVPDKVGPCFLRAVAEEGGNRLQDVMPVGAVRPLSAWLRRDGADFVVQLANPNADYVEGHVTLITPLESWGRAVGSFARCEVAPRLHAFSLGTGEAKLFHFRSRGESAGIWAVAKVAWYGNVLYVQER